MPVPQEIQQLLLIASALSLGAIILALVGVPWVVTRLPADYFSQDRRHSWRESDGEPLFAVVIGLLNVFTGDISWQFMLAASVDALFVVLFIQALNARLQWQSN